MLVKKQALAMTACEEFYQISASICGDIILITLSVSAFFIGLTSWIVIYKFRCYKNYVFLSIIFNNIVNLVIRNISDDCITSMILDSKLLYTFKLTYHLSHLFFKISANYWLLVMCYLFYSDLVKVYNNCITMRYLKTNLFAWGLPLLVCLWNFFIMPKLKAPSTYVLYLYMTALFIPLVINLIIYFIVIYSLMKSSELSIKSSRWRALQMPTLIFLLSGVLMLVMPAQTLLANKPNFAILFMILSRLQGLTVSLYFFTVRQNCSVWTDYHKRRIKIKQDKADLCAKKPMVTV